MAYLLHNGAATYYSMQGEITDRREARERSLFGDSTSLGRLRSTDQGSPDQVSRCAREA
jgi:hypothetical protein